MPPPPPPPRGRPYAAYQEPATQPRQLWRSRENRRFAGVCGGLAEYFGIDPLLIRLAMVGLFISGIGFLLYPLAWLMIPKRPRHRPYSYEAAARPARTRAPADRNLGATLAVLAAVGIMLTSFGALNWLPFGLLLIGGGIWLLSQDPTGTTSMATEVGDPLAAPTPSAPSEPPAPKQAKNPADMTDDELLAAADWTADDVFDEPVGPVGPQSPPPPADDTRRRRAWILLPALAIIGLLALPVAAVGLHWGDGFGEQTIVVTDLADLESDYRWGAGEFVLDLSQLDMQGASRTVDVAMGAGEVVIIAPPDAGGAATLTASFGEVVVNQLGFDTTSAEGVKASLGPVAFLGDNGELTLNVHARAGMVEFRQNR